MIPSPITYTQILSVERRREGCIVTIDSLSIPLVNNPDPTFRVSYIFHVSGYLGNPQGDNQGDNHSFTVEESIDFSANKAAIPRSPLVRTLPPDTQTRERGLGLEAGDVRNIRDFYPSGLIAGDSHIPSWVLLVQIHNHNLI